MSPPSFQTINITLENHIATFVYNNPKANALSVQLLRELIEALTWANDSSDVKVIIVTGGESKFFTAGLDLTNVPEAGPVLPDASIEYLRFAIPTPTYLTYQPRSSRLRTSTKNDHS